jgi:AcrR family transcriptional regulator
MRAAVEAVDPDPERARDFLVSATRFLADADRDSTSMEGSVVLYWQACISALDAILAASGQRVGRGTHSHAVRVEAAATVAGAGCAELFERLDEWRRERTDVSYAAVTPSAATVAAMQTDTRDVVEAATILVDALSP